eukprot:279718-Heterocapsa_arctica.AAC.1
MELHVGHRLARDRNGRRLRRADHRDAHEAGARVPLVLGALHPGRLGAGLLHHLVHAPRRHDGAAAAVCPLPRGGHSYPCFLRADILGHVGSRGLAHRLHRRAHLPGPQPQERPAVAPEEADLH